MNHSFGTRDTTALLNLSGFMLRIATPSKFFTMSNLFCIRNQLAKSIASPSQCLFLSQCLLNTSLRLSLTDGFTQRPLFRSHSSIYCSQRNLLHQLSCKIFIPDLSKTYNLKKSNSFTVRLTKSLSSIPYRPKSSRKYTNLTNLSS